jgi:adenosylcobinamide amidohydrolase
MVKVSTKHEQYYALFLSSICDTNKCSGRFCYADTFKGSRGTVNVLFLIWNTLSDIQMVRLIYVDMN